MGVLDFLFEGKPPASVTTYGQQMTNIPSWLSDYTQGLIARANTIAAEPYQSYGGSRIAGFNPLQTQAHQMAKDNVGDWQPYTSKASSGYSNILSGPGALSKASPYLQAGTDSYTDQVDKYMNPYVENVIDRSTAIAQRKLEEQLMPAIKGNFINAGAYGSAGQQRATGRALRDVTGEIQSQASAALADAYQRGADLHGTEAMRQLQAGQISGGIASDDLGRQLQAAEGQGQLAGLIQSLQGRDVASLAAAGAEQQGQSQKNLDLAYSDFLNQRNYPRETMDWMSGIIRGIPHSTTTNTTGTAPYQGEHQPSGISQLASLWSLYKGISEEFEEARGGLIRRSRGGLAQYAGGGRVRPFQKILRQLQDKRQKSDELKSEMYQRFPDVKEREERILKEWTEKKVTPIRRKARGGLATYRRISNGR